jgi:FdhE protein
MGSVPGQRTMARDETDVDALVAVAEARWRELRCSRPDLGPALRLQRAVVRRQLATAAALTDSALPSPPDPARLAAALARGIPAFRHAPLALPLAVLGPLVSEMCDLLARGPHAREAARRVRAALDAGRCDVGALLAASFARDHGRIRAGAAQIGLSADVLWLAAELALAPFVWRLQRHWLGQGDRTLLVAWSRGLCPACGSWPALAEELASRRDPLTLRCSFCGAAWRRDPGRCVYCDADEASVHVEPPDPLRPDRRVVFCDACSAYLKRVTVPQPTPALLLSILDLATSDLDAAAAARGYGRPSLPDPDASRSPAAESMEGGPA